MADAPFAYLNATPKNGTPVTMLPNRDQAFLDVANAIKAAASKVTPVVAPPGRGPVPMPQGRVIPEAPPQPVGPRSSNLAVGKRFTERDKDAFQFDTFEYLARFFQSSAAELERRNPGIETTFRKIDANRFSTVIYRDGQPVSRCSIFIGDRSFMTGICYSAQETEGGSFNELLRVEADEQSLFLRSMGMAASGSHRGGESALSQEGAAEFYWTILMRPLQHR